jgi:tetratricopeptide (TPR) repeat protein
MAASAAILALFIIAPPAVVEAAVVNRKLNELTRDPALSPDGANAVADALTTASNGPISLPLKTLLLVRDAIKNSEPNSAVARAANALLKYNRDINPPTLIDPPKTEAERAFLEAGMHFIAAIDWRRPIDFQEANAALSGLSRTIELSASEPTLRIASLLDRALLYTRLGRPTEALADVEAAENAGALDLAFIISVETSAMLSRRQQKDLAEVIQLVRLGLQIDPPAWARSNVATQLYSVELIRTRATAYYLLGQFAAAEEDCRAALRVVPPDGVQVHFLFEILICSYLKMGQMRQAQAATDEWEARNGDKRAREVREVLQSHPTDPQGALIQLEKLFRI